MFFRRRISLKNVLAALLVIVLYDEFLVHRVQRWWWRTQDCDARDTACTRLLLIADPQVQGELAVPAPFSYLFNWDSDRYVKQTFTVAMEFFKPDIIIFLGDLTDEGSISSMPQFHRYIKRLSEIFDTNQSVMQVWIPGDNDIGGENERIAPDKVKEFSAVFAQPDVLVFPHNVVVYKVNRITHTMPEIPVDHAINMKNFNIIVSHYPLLGTGLFALKAIETLQPDLIFSAHDHTAKYAMFSPSMTRKTSQRISPGDDMIEIHFDNSTVHEISVPTCSYRMGVAKMGYGAAVLDRNNERLRYQVLWSSSRFPVLFFYLCILIIFLCYFIFYNICCRRPMNRL